MGDIMKYIKIFVCIIFSFVITGCSATYKLNIDKELVFDEKLKLSLNYNSDYDKLEEFNYNLPVDINVDDIESFNKRSKDIEYFNVKKSLESGTVNFNYKYLDYNKVDYDRIINTCYEHFTIINKKGDDGNYKLILSTSKEFKCFDLYDNLEDVTISILTKKKVYDNNADSVSGNTYTWYINEDNKDDVSISMVIDGNIDNSLSFIEKNLLFLITIGVFLVGGLIYIILKKRSDKVDEI